MIRYFCTLIATFLLFSVAAEAQQKIAVLVPGFFNIPGHKDATSGLPYFSQTVVQAVQDSGYTTVVINDLNPVGNLQQNGDQLLGELQDLTAQNPGARFTMIAHSAGGLYVAHALTLQPDLPIADVVTISTPYAGAKLVDLLKWIPGFATITSWLDLGALQEFEGSNMAPLIASLNVPQSVRWVALGAAQTPCTLLSCTRAEYQTWVLSLAWKFAGTPGDGVVAVESATAQNVLRAREGGAKTIELWPDYVVPLEHWKTVLDSSFFTLLGETDTGWIAQTQRQTFMQILTRLNAP